MSQTSFCHTTEGPYIMMLGLSHLPSKVLQMGMLFACFLSIMFFFGGGVGITVVQSLKTYFLAEEQ